MFNNPESHETSPFGPTGHGTFGNPTTVSHDTFGRDVFSRSSLTGPTTHETRDHFGNVIDRRESFFD
jgi:hypothetical protein